MSDLTNDSQNKKKSLGRGLGSLLGAAQSQDRAPFANEQSPQSRQNPIASPAIPRAEAAPQTPPEARIWKIAVDKLRPSAFQPRSHFDKAKLEELSQSIKVSGILQPIVARKLANGSFEIIAGERRWRASQIAGLHEVPVILKTFTDRETLEMALVENIQREDLSPIEEAEAYQRLAQEFQLTQQQVAEKVGRDRATVANAIRLLQLPNIVQEMISNQQISVGHAKVLLAIADPAELKKLAKRITEESLSVRKLEKIVQEKLKPVQNKSEELMNANVTEQYIGKLADEIQKRIGTKVQIDYHQGKGKLSVHFYSDDELSKIVERLKA